MVCELWYNLCDVERYRKCLQTRRSWCIFFFAICDENKMPAMAYSNCKKIVLKVYYACSVRSEYRNLACSIGPNRACRPPPRARICTRNVASAPYLNTHGEQAASHLSEKRASKSWLSPQGSDNAISVLLRHGNRYFFFFTRVLESCSREDGVFTCYLSLSMLYTRGQYTCSARLLLLFVFSLLWIQSELTEHSLGL